MTDTQPNTLKGRSYQELFDEMLAHLRKQGEPAFSQRTGLCYYRIGLGLKCAVGALIPDELYDSSLEEAGLGEIIYMLRGETPDHNKVPDEHGFLADARCYLHDRPAREFNNHGIDFKQGVEKGALTLAKKYGLTYKPILPTKLKEETTQ